MEDHYQNQHASNTRFCILLLFSLSSITNAIAWICFAPIFSLLQKEYGASLSTVNYMSSSYLLMFLPMNLPSVYALDKYGLRTGVCLGIILTTLGLWVKFFINQCFLTVVIGQTICAIANPFLNNAIVKVTRNWFP